MERVEGGRRRAATTSPNSATPSQPSHGEVDPRSSDHRAPARPRPGATARRVAAPPPAPRAVPQATTASTAEAASTRPQLGHQPGAAQPAVLAPPGHQQHREVGARRQRRPQRHAAEPQHRVERDVERHVGRHAHGPSRSPAPAPGRGRRTPAPSPSPPSRRTARARSRPAPARSPRRRRAEPAVLVDERDDGPAHHRQADRRRHVEEGHQPQRRAEGAPQPPAGRVPPPPGPRPAPATVAMATPKTPSGSCMSRKAICSQVAAPASCEAKMVFTRMFTWVAESPTTDGRHEPADAAQPGIGQPGAGQPEQGSHPDGRAARGAGRQLQQPAEQRAHRPAHHRPLRRPPRQPEPEPHRDRAHVEEGRRQRRGGEAPLGVEHPHGRRRRARPAAGTASSPG